MLNVQVTLSESKPLISYKTTKELKRDKVNFNILRLYYILKAVALHGQIGLLQKFRCLCSDGVLGEVLKTTWDPDPLISYKKKEKIIELKIILNV